MSEIQPALRQLHDPHVYALSETCPLCDQPVPNEKAQVIRARMEASERSLTEAANDRATQRITAETVRIEAAASATVEQIRRENEDALKKTTAESAAKVEAACAEVRGKAEAAFGERLAAAEKAKTDAEAAAAQKVAAAEETARAREAVWQANIHAAVTEKHDALVQVDAMKAEQEALVNERVREVREGLERDKADTIAANKAAQDAETQKLSAKLEILQRQLDKQRADELGEGAHIKLLDALKDEFSGDDIRRIRPGVSGADILHTIIHNGKPSGAILYESKNSTAWRDDYVTKLVGDQTAARADHAILSTFKFPAGTSQVEVRDGVVIVNPARAIAIARILRKHLLHVHTMRLSKAERTQKMAGIYDFITSERYTLLLTRIDGEAEALLELQASEKTFHENHWKKQGLRLKSIQKVKADLDTEIDTIIGAADPVS
jgi:hypothetical protein